MAEEIITHNDEIKILFIEPTLPALDERKYCFEIY